MKPVPTPCLPQPNGDVAAADGDTAAYAKIFQPACRNILSSNTLLHV
jgi:hypothetical protein